MGIKQLMSLLQEKAPGCIKKIQLEGLTGYTVACDASMAMYQFLVATQGMNQVSGLTEMTDKDGNRTGHLVGLLSRTIQFLEHGVRPIWVFDGKAPTLKNGELAKRKKIKDEAKRKAEDAEDVGDLEQALKHKVMNTHISKKMTEDCKKMLRLAGIPVIEAPGEAEAQCAALVKAGKAYATATEDMDALTFATAVLLRGFNNKKEPIYEINFKDMLEELGMTYDQFVDLCILCGCDYLETIEGIGPVTAFKLIKEHKDIEGVIKKLEDDNKKGDKKRKWNVPDPFFYPDARELFKTPLVIEDVSKIEIKWEKPNEEELTQFLVEEKGFSDVRVSNAIKKLQKVDNKGQQSRLESFFGVSKRKATPVKTEEKSAKKGKGAKAKK